MSFFTTVFSETRYGPAVFIVYYRRILLFYFQEPHEINRGVLAKIYLGIGTNAVGHIYYDSFMPL